MKAPHSPAHITRRRLRRGMLALGLLIAFWILLIGPWPVPTTSDRPPAFLGAALAELAATTPAALGVGQTNGSLQGGIGTVMLALPAPAPLAGYGDRKGAAFRGYRDPLSVKSLLLHDGTDQVLLFAADLLIMPPTVAARVHTRLEVELGFQPHQVLFTASHTHSGPGGFAPGLVGNLFAGDFNPAVVDALAQAFIDAAQAAQADLQSVEIATGATAAPDLIRNRLIPEGEVHPHIPILAVRSPSGPYVALVTGFSAHPTLLGPDNLALSGDYPAALERALEAEIDAPALFAGGAVGSMAPDPPEGDFSSRAARAEAMGRSLAEKVIQKLPELVFTCTADLASLRLPIQLPNPQVRLNSRWRLSPILTRFLLPTRIAALNALRIGDQIWFGTPCDFSGELANDLARTFESLGVQAVACSFNGEYIGYVLPDEYREMQSYESMVMNWYGPRIGSAFTRILTEAGHLLTRLPAEQQS